MTTTIHLIDASPYLFRSWFVLPKSIVDTADKPVNAVHGFATFLARYLADERPTHIAVAFDRNFNQSFRNNFYPEYKAHRDASPPELDAQVDPCVEVTEAIGVTSLIDPDYEADDLIATAIDQTKASGANYVIVTIDKDLAQLVSDRVSLVDPGRARFDAAAVEAKFGVRPDQIVDYLALAGDAVDNIPGVRGIGAKTAAQLLQRFGSLERIYENVPSMKASKIRGDGSTATKLERDVENAGMSKRLATVSTEAPIKVSVDSLRYRGPDDERIDALFGRLGFKNLRVRVGSGK